MFLGCWVCMITYANNSHFKNQDQWDGIYAEKDNNNSFLFFKVCTNPVPEWAALRDAALPEISKTEFGGPPGCLLRQHIYTKIGGPLGPTTVEKFKD